MDSYMTIIIMLPCYRIWTVTWLSHHMTQPFTNGQSHEDYQITIYGQLCCHLSPCRHVHHSMLGMRHGNGRPVCVLYCDTDYEDPTSQGAIVNFNLLRADGSFVGYSEVCFSCKTVCQSGRGFTIDSVAPAMSLSWETHTHTSSLVPSRLCPA